MKKILFFLLLILGKVGHAQEAYPLQSDTGQIRAVHPAKGSLQIDLPEFLPYWKTGAQKEDEGHPYVADYESALKYGNQNLDITINSRNVIFLANRRGVQIFDGINWQRVQLPFLVYKIIHKAGRIYLGGDNNFGYIARTPTGSYTFHSLKAAGQNVGIIDRVVTSDKYVFFGGYKAVMRYNTATGNLKAYVDREPVFNGFLVYQNQLFVNVSGEGLWNFPGELLHDAEDTLSRNVVNKIPYKNLFQLANDSANFSREEILFAFPLDSSRLLIGTDSNFLYEFNGQSLKRHEIKAADFIRESILTDGIRLSRHTYALATRTGGCLVIDIAAGETLQTINYQNGLPDDEVEAVGVDQNGGLWLVHGFGLSRADFSLPVRDFTNIPGLEGAYTGIMKHQDKLFVTTTEGVFYKDQVKNFKEIRRLVRVKKQETKQEPGEQSIWKRIFSQKKQEKKQQAEDEEKPGFIKRIFRKLTGKEKKKQTQQEEQASPDETTERSDAKPASAYTYKVRKSYALQSVKHVFRQVENLEAKVLDAKSIAGQFLIATNKGLYYLQQEQAVPIIKNTYIYGIALAEGHKDAAWIAARDGFYRVAFRNGHWQMEIAYSMKKPVYSIVEAKQGVCWLGTDDQAVRVIIDSANTVKNIRYFPLKAPFSERIEVMNPQPGNVLVAADQVFKYKAEADSLVKLMENEFSGATGKRLMNTQDSLVWHLTEAGWRPWEHPDLLSRDQLLQLKLFDQVNDFYVDRDSNLWLINRHEGLYQIVHDIALNPGERHFHIHIDQIRNNKDQLMPLSDFRLDYGSNALQISLGAPYYLGSNQVEFQYKLEGLNDEWSQWRQNPVIEIPFIPYGTYELHIRGRNLFGVQSQVKQVSFYIETPFWMRWWFIATGSLIVVFVISMLVYLRLRKLRLENIRLENKVEERTGEIRRKQKEITDSIYYGRRIQQAMLPPADLIQRNDTEHFMFSQPRDIVSGDFYWFSQHGNKLLYAAVDCTGHGVPAAFLSMLGIAFLNEIVNNRKINRPDQVLNELRAYIIKALHQKGNPQEQQDGMNMALVTLDYAHNKIEYAGAYNPLYLIRNNELKTIKANRMPIGIYHGEFENFTLQTLDMQPGDMLYLFSDGFADQLGGGQKRKYMAGKMKQFLLEIHTRPLQEQKELLKKEFFAWKGEHEQLDDVLVMGIAIKKQTS